MVVVFVILFIPYTWWASTVKKYNNCYLKINIAVTAHPLHNTWHYNRQCGSLFIGENEAVTWGLLANTNANNHADV